MLSERQEKLINSIVDLYIKSAEPVSSGLLGKAKFHDISSATIRNEMNELEQLGYLVQLHTSGGRVPTDRAYRYYVNEVMSSDLIPSKNIQEKVRQALDSAEPDARSINRAVAELVAELSDNLAISNSRDDFFKIGLAGLFEFPEFREFDRMFNVTQFFEHFESIFEEMEGTLLKEFGGQDHAFVKVMIGRENPFKTVQRETVILAKYSLPEYQSGTLTVVGPTRMDYQKNLSLIKCVVDEINSKFI